MWPETMSKSSSYDIFWLVNQTRSGRIRPAPPDQVRLQYERIAPELAGGICVWPAGVDENDWQPNGRRVHDTLPIVRPFMRISIRISFYRLQLMSRFSENELADFIEGIFNHRIGSS